jgi:hypothetical protein
MSTTVYRTFLLLSSFTSLYLIAFPPPSVLCGPCNRTFVVHWPGKPLVFVFMRVSAEVVVYGHVRCGTFVPLGGVVRHILFIQSQIQRELEVEIGLSCIQLHTRA